MTMHGRFYTLKSLGMVREQAEIGPLAGQHDDAAPKLRQDSKCRMRQQCSIPGGDTWGHKVPKGVVAGAMAVLLAACAGMTPGVSRDASPQVKQTVVAERAEARWQALIKGDLDTAYTFLSPGSKATTSLAVYKSKIKPGIWRRAKADKVSCEGEICSVTIQITFDTPKAKGIETQLAERWIIEDGAAWYVYL